MNKLDIVYYFGVIALTFAVIMIMIQKFVEYEEIDLNEHFMMIVIYIILLIFAIILWKLFFDFLFGFEDILNPNIDYKSILNG